MKFGLVKGLAVLLACSAALAEPETLTLPQIVAIAEAQLESVKIQELQTQLAREDLKKLESTFYPSLAFLVDYTRIDEPTISSDSGVSTVFYNPNQYSGRLAMTLNGIQGLREYYGHKMARLNVQAQKELETNVRRLLLIEITQAYFFLMSARSDLSNLERLYQASSARELQLRRLVNLGRSPRSDLLQQRTQLSIAQTSVAQAKGAILAAENSLRAIAGLDADAKIADDTSPLPDTFASLSEFLGELDSRSDIRFLSKQSDLAQASIALARSDYFPSLDLKANLYAFRSGVLATSLWDFGFSLRVPLFEGFHTASAVRAGQITFNKNKLELLAGKRAATKEIQRSYDQARNIFVLLPSLKETLKQADSYYQAVRSDYERKQVRNLDVNLALNQLYSIKRSYDQSVNSFKAAFQTLLVTSGRQL